MVGKTLVRVLEGERLSGMVIEAEAYQGIEDMACHARVGLTPRTQVMFGEAGHAYIYFTYGMHWMLNVVSDEKDIPAAVLIRAIYPLEGLARMQALRSYAAGKADWLNGPAKLTQALGLDRALNGADLCAAESSLWFEEGVRIPAAALKIGPRVGLGKTPEPWLSKPWRWQISLVEAEKMIETQASGED